MNKVVFLIYSMEKAGGSERVTANIANELASDRRYEVYVYTLSGKSSFFRLAETVHLVHLNKTGSRNLINLGKLFISSINRLRPQTVVGISIGRLNIFLSICALFYQTKINLVASEHISYGSVSKFQNLIKRVFYKRFDRIGVLTEHDKAIMQKDGLKNVVLIRNAASYFPEIENLKPIISRQKQILAIGRLEDQKGFDLLIEAWAKIYSKHKEWKLVVVGEGSLEHILKAKIGNSFSNSSACQIFPFTNDVNVYYEESQIYLLSSRFEGLPMVMIEAMCFGLPLVSFNCETGPREIVVDGKNGYLVKNGDVDELGHKLSQLISDDITREAFSSQCMEDRGKYKIQNIIEQWKIKLL